MSQIKNALFVNNLTERTMDAFATSIPELDFKNWISTNWHIWEAFHEHALKMAQTGRDHYSARTICEVMRWNTDLYEIEGRFKISNNVIPKMARLFEAVNPEYSGFFRKKGGS